MPSTYETARIVGATPKRLFEAWLDSQEHSGMTGRAATIVPGHGEPFSTAEGQIMGRTLEAEPYHRIVQGWNAEEPGGRVFESQVEITFVTGPNWGGLPGSPADGATIKIRHWGLPPEQRLFTPQWWEDNYFRSMDAYFARGSARFIRPSPLNGSRKTTEIIQFREHLIHQGFAYAYAVSAVDITGSGSLDLVTVDTNVGLYLFENDGNGNFTHHVIRRRVGEWLERHAIADINGDGKPEIVSVDNTNGCLLYFAYDGDPRDSASWTHNYITEGELPGAYDLTVADLNGDGDLDVAASSWRIGNHFAWFENRDGAWVKHMIEDNIGETRAIHAVDFDGDGLPDLLGTAFTGNQVMWYRNPGDPANQPWHKYVIDDSAGPMHGHPVDMNGDGNIDVVMALRGSDDPENQVLNQIVWYENNGSPETVPWKKHVIADGFPMAFEAVAADIDGDGEIEVVATAWGEDGRVTLFKHRGDPKGPWDMQVLKEGWSNVTQAILVDLNSNGRLDIVACAERGSNELRWWRNEGPAEV
jgi:hypothetical protein